MKKQTLICTVIFGIFWCTNTLASVQDKVKAIQEMPHRNDADKARDDNRQPAKALAFFGLKEDMKVIEFLPGAGWYSKILAPILKDSGELYIVGSHRGIKNLDSLLAAPPMKNTKKVPINIQWNKDHYALDDVDFSINDADMVLNIRMYHAFNDEGKAKINAAAYQALKPGGSYVIVDHTRRHMEEETPELNRREDPVDVILGVQKAGFILEKYSAMFYKPDDELRYEVGRKSVAGNTDRFSLIFKKPMHDNPRHLSSIPL